MVSGCHSAGISRAEGRGTIHIGAEGDEFALVEGNDKVWFVTRAQVFVCCEPERDRVPPGRPGLRGY